MPPLFPPPHFLSPLLRLQSEISLSSFGTDGRFFPNKNPVIFEILGRNTVPFLKPCSQRCNLEISIAANKRCLRPCCKTNWTQFVEGYLRDVDFFRKCSKVRYIEPIGCERLARLNETIGFRLDERSHLHPGGVHPKEIIVYIWRDLRLELLSNGSSITSQPFSGRIFSNSR